MSEAGGSSEPSGNEALIDRAKDVREGEGLDLEALGAWLRAQPGVAERLGEAKGAAVEVQQFPSGYSNLTYMIQIGAHELVLRRPPFGNTVKSGHDMGREHRVLSTLAPVYPLAPEPWAYCEDESVIGAPFYVMERRRGIIIRRRLPKGMALDEAGAKALSTALIDGLADLHRIDYAGIGLGELGRPEGYARRQVEGWTRRWQKAQTDALPLMDQVAAWLDAELPADADADAALIHNDYKYDNVVLDPEDPARIIAVLDWEMATIGSPRMDLGTTLGYWVETNDDKQLHALAFGPTYAPGSLSRAELVARYEERSGIQVGDATYYRVFGLFKIAVIIQQIYARYKKGSTQDPRFAMLGHVVSVLAQVAGGAIDQDRC